MVKIERNCRISVDSYTCNGCESCVELLPEFFRICEATGKVETVNDTAPCSENLDRTAATCPLGCINIIEVT